MKRKITQIDTRALPPELRSVVSGADVYDSSCSDAARVYFIERDGGYFLKTAAAGLLRREYEMARFFRSRGLAAETVCYISADRDYLLTRRIPGEDCTHFTDEPERLTDTLAAIMRALHESDAVGCVEVLPNMIEESVKRRGAGVFHASEVFGIVSPDEAWETIERGAGRLRADTLIHGDFCLPNVILDGWRFSGFVDVVNGGISDRHFDIADCVWSLWYNLGTDRFTDRFLDAYGRERIDPDCLRVAAAMQCF